MTIGRVCIKLVYHLAKNGSLGIRHSVRYNIARRSRYTFGHRLVTYLCPRSDSTSATTVKVTTDIRDFFSGPEVSLISEVECLENTDKT